MELSYDPGNAARSGEENSELEFLNKLWGPGTEQE
jgi:hypothetical protein